MTTTREAFERNEARCPSCRRPIGPDGKPSYVRSLGNEPPRLATMRCARCNAMLTIRFGDGPTEEAMS